MSNRFDEQLDVARFAAGALVQVFAADSSTEEAREAAVDYLEMTIEELSIASAELDRRLSQLDELTAASERERARYEQLFDDAPEAAIVTDRFGTIEELNRRACQLLETTARYAVGKPLSVFVAGASRREFRRRLTAAGSTTADVQSWQLEVSRRDAGELVVEIVLQRSADLPDGGGPGFRWTLLSRPAAAIDETDIPPPPVLTDQRPHDELLARIAELEERAERGDLILSALAHDVRAPLAIIEGLAEVEEARARGDRGGDHPTTGDIAGAIRWQSRRALRLVEDLLALNRDGPLRTTDASDCDVRAVLQGVVDDVGARDHQVTISGDERADVDPRILARIAANLLTNAVKLSPKDSEINVRTWAAAGDLLLAVEDRGPGFGDREQGRVFEPFGRLDRDADLPGWGLGLSIVAELAALHGGSAWVVNRSGGGGSVQVLLRSTARTAGPADVSPA